MMTLLILGLLALPACRSGRKGASEDGGGSGSKQGGGGRLNDDGRHGPARDALEEISPLFTPPVEARPPEISPSPTPTPTSRPSPTPSASPSPTPSEVPAAPPSVHQ